MKNLDVFLKIQSTCKFFGVGEDAVAVCGSLLPLAEQHRAEAHSQVLAGHLVHFVVRSHQLQMIQQHLQGCLSMTKHNLIQKVVRCL